MKSFLAAAGVALAVAVPPGTARAAACCLSTSAFGAGRLAVWEEAAVGIHLSGSTASGLFDGEGVYRPYDDYEEREARTTLFALVRLADTLEAGARVPWVIGSRTAGSIDETGHGLGDLSLSMRWEALALGAIDHLPGIAFTLGATLPTGRATDQTDQVLGADVTGRGFTVLSAGVSLERAHQPWFVRLDLAGLLPLAHEVRGHTYRSGPGLELQVGGGVDLGAGVVVALAPRLRWESDGTRDGRTLEDSATLELAIGPSASWAFDPHWTLQASFDTGLPVDGLGSNRPLSTSASIGIRHAIY